MTKVTLTAKEAARLLGISTHSMYELLERGDNPPPHFRVGVKYVIPRRALEEWINMTAWANAKGTRR